jgi:hypothetical protein
MQRCDSILNMYCKALMSGFARHQSSPLLLPFWIFQDMFQSVLGPRLILDLLGTLFELPSKVFERDSQKLFKPSSQCVDCYVVETDPDFQVKDV